MGTEISTLIQKLESANIAFSRDKDKLNNLSKTTIPTSRNVTLVIWPTSSDQVVEFVNLANIYEVKFQVVSTGNNWGYGSALATDNKTNVIVSLERMQAIEDFDSRLGFISIEPGVTQKGLDDYLREVCEDFYVPITGSSPNCSIIGNALERGFGITPLFDHASAIVSLEAVLPTGEIYKSSLSSSYSSLLERVYAHGIGPNLDHLFFQSANGIVTKVQLKLIKRRSSYYVFSALLTSEASKKDFFDCLPKLCDEIGKDVINVKLSNPSYLKTVQPKRFSNLSNDSLLVWGMLYGEPTLQKPRIKLLKKHLRPFSKNLKYISSRQIKIAKKVSKLIFLKSFKNFVESISVLESYGQGTPSFNGLKLLYDSKELKVTRDINPAKDGKSLIWFPVILPMHYDLNFKFQSLLKELKVNLLPVTYTVVSDSTLIAIVVLTCKEGEDRNKLLALYDNLFQAIKKIGLLPYRGNIDRYKSFLTSDNKDFWELNHRIKKCLDPKMLLNPGRYDPLYDDDNL